MLPLPPLPPRPLLAAHHPPTFTAHIDPVSRSVVVTSTNQPAGPCVVFDDLAGHEPTWSDWDEAHERENWAYDQCDGSVRLRWFRYDDGVLVPLLACEHDDDVELLADRFGRPISG